MFLAIVSCKYGTTTLISVFITLFHMLEIISMEVNSTNYYLHCLFLQLFLVNIALLLYKSSLHGS